MSLKEKIIADMTAAMKAKDALVLGTLRMLKAEIMKYEVSGTDKAATDEVVIELIQRAIKQRKESIEGFEKGGNAEAAENERQEIAVLQGYLPQQMSLEELKAVAAEVASQMGVSDPSSFGKVMGAVMAKVKGRAEGNLVSQAVKEALQ